MAASGSPRIGVAFGGGGARGLAHIHVIRALDELGLRPAAIAGSSIGALMGAGMAAGMPGREIEDFLRAVLGRRAEVASRMWQARPTTLVEAFGDGFGFTQFNLERILGAFLPDAVPRSFGELAIPLQVTATDFFGHGQAVFRDGDLRSALAASAAIPAVFRPVRRDGRLLIDGGIVNPVPFDLLEDEADIVIAVDVVGAPTERGRGRVKAIDLMFGASQLMMQSISAAKLRQKAPDVLIRPLAVSRFRVLDFLKIGAVLAETAAVRDDAKRAVTAALERWQRVDAA